MAGGLFNSSPVGSVAIVEPPVSQWYARRARVTALVVGLASGVLVTAGAGVFCRLWLAVLLGVAAGVVFAVVAGVLVRVWPVLRALWWWSFEITAVTFVVGGWVTLAHLTTWWVALAVMVLPLVAGAGFKRVRWFVWSWSWCLVDRHRLRSCFTRIVRNAAGSTGGWRPVSAPLMLWARPSLAGERVWLWLRPGLSLEALEQDGVASLIAVTCWASYVRMSRATAHLSGLVRMDVTRRDPLTGMVESPLSRLVPSLRDANADVPVSPAVPPVGLDLADIEEPAPEPPRGSRR